MYSEKGIFLFKTEGLSYKGQELNHQICFSILISSKDRKTNSLVRFLEEVLAGKFIFNFYWPLLQNLYVELWAELSLPTCYCSTFSVAQHGTQWMTDYPSLWPKSDFLNLRLRFWPPNFISENFHLSHLHFTVRSAEGVPKANFPKLGTFGFGLCHCPKA